MGFLLYFNFKESYVLRDVQTINSYKILITRFKFKYNKKPMKCSISIIFLLNKR